MRTAVLGSLLISTISMLGPGCDGATPLEADAGRDAHVPPADGGVLDAWVAPDATLPPDAAVPPDSGPDPVDAAVSGCGWSPDTPGFVCGSSAMPPAGDPNVTCEGTTCTYTNPDATCFIQSCDSATGTIITCTYSGGACPCEAPVLCE